MQGLGEGHLGAVVDGYVLEVINGLEGRVVTRGCGRGRGRLASIFPGV